MKLLSSVIVAVCCLMVGITHSEQLIFEDDFSSLDLSKWKHEISMGGGGNWEFQMYVNNRQNSFVDDGKLVLQPTYTVNTPGNTVGESILSAGRVDIWGTNPADYCTSNQDWGCMREGNPTNILNPIRSARIRTAESFNFKYGRVEVRARLPRGDWLWPAIWMLPASNSYGNWPSSGEIDIMESRGNLNIGKGMGVESVGSTLHWGTSPNQNGYPFTQAAFSLPEGQDFSQDFHTFGLYWDKHQLYTYVDDDANRVLQVDFSDSFFSKATKNGETWDFNPWAREEARGEMGAPFNQPFYLVMNVAVGGTGGYWPDSIPGKPWNNEGGTSPKDFWAARSQWEPSWGNKEQYENALVVDSVKVYSVEGTEFFDLGQYQSKKNFHTTQLSATFDLPQSSKEGLTLNNPLIITGLVMGALALILVSSGLTSKYLKTQQSAPKIKASPELPIVQPVLEGPHSV